MTLDEFRRHPAYDYYIITLVSDCLVCDLETKFDNQYTIIYMKRPNFDLCKYNKNKHIQPCNYCPLVRYLCLGIDCRAVILKQVKHEKK